MSINGMTIPQLSKAKAAALAAAQGLNALGQLPLMSVAEAAAASLYSRASIYRLVQQGEFPLPIPLGPGRTAFVRAEVLAWVASKTRARPTTIAELREVNKEKRRGLDARFASRTKVKAAPPTKPKSKTTAGRRERARVSA